MKLPVVLSLISVSLLILPRISHQTECGKRLGKGAVICTLGIQGAASDSFDYNLCTHASIVVHTRCESAGCYPVNDSDFETMYQWVRPYSLTKLGLLVTLDGDFRDPLDTRLKRLNTAKAFFQFMTEKNLTFIQFEEPTLNNGFKDVEDRNALQFIQEIARGMHDRNWLIGLKVHSGTTEFTPAYNFDKLSEYVDYFAFSTRKSITAGYDVGPLTPLSASDRDAYIGTTKYWIEKALQKLKPECVVLIIDVFGVRYHTKENSAEPGPGSKARLDIKSVLFVQLCYKLLVDSTCQEHWDDESSTPWAACGNEFYSYENGRSSKAKTDLARQYNLAGMSIYLARRNTCESRNPILLVNALQGIRNTTSTKTQIQQNE